MLIARFALVRWTHDAVLQRLRQIVVRDSCAGDAQRRRLLNPVTIQRSLEALEFKVLCQNDLKCISLYYFNETLNKLVGLRRSDVRWLLEEYLPEHAAFGRCDPDKRFDDVRWIFAT